MRDDDDQPRRPVTHTLGDPLDTLSVEEIDARLVLLAREVARLEAARTAKKAALDAAGSIFKF